MISHLWKHRELIFQLTRMRILQQYKGSYLGLFWSVLKPLSMMLVYTFVFSVIINAKWHGGASGTHSEFAITLFTGYIAFNIFSESVQAAPSLVLNNPSYVKKVIFPIEVLPVISTFAVVVDSFFSMVILLLGTIFILDTFPWTLVFLPAIYVPLILLSLGFSWFLASLGVFFKDLQHLVFILIQMLFFLTPLFYSLSAVPEAYRKFYIMNPLAAIVNHFRMVILWGEIPPLHEYVSLTLICLVICFAGYRVFARNRTLLSDMA